MENPLDKLLSKITTLLSKRRLNYLIIGGLAAGFLGEPRMTADVDLILFIAKEDVSQFLKAAKKAGFAFTEKTVLSEVAAKGAFKIILGNLWVDIIIASTEFEKSALERKIRVKFMGKTVYIPSAEDFLLLKIIPGRDKDILDAKSVIERHGKKLNKKYMETWAQKLSDEAEDLRIWNTLKKLMG